MFFTIIINNLYFLFSQKFGKEVQITGAETEIKTPSGDKVAVIKKDSNGKLSVHVPGDLYTRVEGNKLIVTPNEHLKGRLTGVCGSLDENNLIDEVGPARCIYHDATLFRSSWTSKVSKAQGCKNKLIGKVIEYQNNCKKAPTSTINQSMSTSLLKSSNMKMSHKVIKRGSEYCVTLDKVKECIGGKDEIASRKELSTATKCLPENTTPETIKQSNFVDSLPSEVTSHGVPKTQRVHVPIRCRA